MMIPTTVFDCCLTNFHSRFSTMGCLSAGRKDTLVTQAFPLPVAAFEHHISHSHYPQHVPEHCMTHLKYWRTISCGQQTALDKSRSLAGFMLMNTQFFRSVARCNPSGNKKPQGDLPHHGPKKGCRTSLLLIFHFVGESCLDQFLVHITDPFRISDVPQTFKEVHKQ